MAESIKYFVEDDSARASTTTAVVFGREKQN